jgi:hypothetical protein
MDKQPPDMRNILDEMRKAMLEVIGEEINNVAKRKWSML